MIGSNVLSPQDMVRWSCGGLVDNTKTMRFSFVIVDHRRSKIHQDFVVAAPTDRLHSFYQLNLGKSIIWVFWFFKQRYHSREWHPPEGNVDANLSKVIHSTSRVVCRRFCGAVTPCSPKLPNPLVCFHSTADVLDCSCFSGRPSLG
jgi:hypothetical protein